jgi:hypothetical protein
MNSDQMQKDGGPAVKRPENPRARAKEVAEVSQYVEKVYEKVTLKLPA